MRLILTLLTTALLTSCADPYFHVVSIEPQLEPYRQIYIDECLKRRSNCNVGNITLQFKSLKSTTTLGNCRRYSTGNYAEITINTDTWGMLNESHKEVLIMHEYGHCHLGRHHVDTMIDFGGFLYFSSVLSTYIISPYVYDKYRDYYLDELFQ